MDQKWYRIRKMSFIMEARLISPELTANLLFSIKLFGTIANVIGKCQVVN